MPANAGEVMTGAGGRPAIVVQAPKQQARHPAPR